MAELRAPTQPTVGDPSPGDLRLNVSPGIDLCFRLPLDLEQITAFYHRFPDENTLPEIKAAISKRFFEAMINDSAVRSHSVDVSCDRQMLQRQLVSYSGLNGSSASLPPTTPAGDTHLPIRRVQSSSPFIMVQPHLQQPKKRQRRTLSPNERREIARNRGNVCSFHAETRTKCDPNFPTGCPHNTLFKQQQKASLAIRQQMSVQTNRLDPAATLVSSKQLNRSTDSTQLFEAFGIENFDQHMLDHGANGVGPQASSPTNSVLKMPTSAAADTSTTIPNFFPNPNYDFGTLEAETTMMFSMTAPQPPNLASAGDHWAPNRQNAGYFDALSDGGVDMAPSLAPQSAQQERGYSQYIDSTNPKNNSTPQFTKVATSDLSFVTAATHRAPTYGSGATRELTSEQSTRRDKTSFKWFSLRKLSSTLPGWLVRRTTDDLRVGRVGME